MTFQTATAKTVSRTQARVLNIALWTLQVLLAAALQIHQIPVLFGGRRLFDVLPSRVELKIVRVIDTPEATHIHKGQHEYCSNNLSAGI